MKAPRIRGRFLPRRVDGGTAWISEDGVWVVLQRTHLESVLGRSLGDDDPDLGVVMGTGGEEPEAAILELDTVSVEAIREPPAAAPAPPASGVAAAMAWATHAHTDPDAGSGRVEVAPSADAGPPPEAMVEETLDDSEEPTTPMATSSTQELRRQLAHTQPVLQAEEDREAKRFWLMSLGVLGFAVILLASALFVAFQQAPAPAPTARLGPVEEEGTAPAFVEPPARVPGTAGLPEGAVNAVPKVPTAGVPTVAASANVPAWQTHIDKGWDVLPQDPALAADAFRRALALYPRHGDAHHGLGTALLRQGKPEEAKPYLCEARRLDSTLAPSIDDLMGAYGLNCDAR